MLNIPEVPVLGFDPQTAVVIEVFCDFPHSLQASAD
jgi:hypothetical protein